MPKPADVLRGVRKMALLLPETRETLTFGNPTFQARTKTFAVLDRYRGRRCLCFKAALGDQARLCRDPRFFVAPYSGKHGWTCLDVDGRFRWTQVEGLLHASYRLVAPKRLVAALDAHSTSGIPKKKRSANLGASRRRASPRERGDR